jgi:Serine kinase of the HPr protein, regulates carbohydrate metabolism
MSCDSLRVLRHLPAGRTGIVRRRRLGASRKGGEGRLHENGLKISEFVKLFSLEVLNRGSDYEEALLTITDVNRPGLQFHDFYDYFDPRRIQVIGKAEVMYLKGLTPEARKKCFDDLFLYDIPALVIARNLDCFPECLQSAQEHEKTLLRTEETTVDFTSHTIEYLNRGLAPSVTRHGVLMDVYGEGVMITGDSGIGKSETAIELVMRGHRLVADDAVEIRRVSNELIGTAPEVIRHYIELRGIGVIDVRQLFGMRAIKTEAPIDLVVQLEQWDSEKVYDRLGLEDHYTDIMDLQIPCVTIPVRPGRNLASIVEVAAMNNRHRRYGYNAAEELARRVDLRADEGSRQAPQK